MRAEPENELRQVLGDVSRACLRGDAVPSDLAALWRAQLADDTELLDAYEMTLLDDVDPDLFEGFRESEGVEPAVARAFDRMASQILWVAEALDGSLLGYWVGEQQRRVADSPVVLCDPDGQFELTARTLAEFLLDCTDPDDPDDFAEVREALEDIGVHIAVDDHHAIARRVDGYDDPNAITMAYVIEERMRG